MSVVEMNKLLLIGPASDREDILKELMDFGVIHVVDSGSGIPEDVFKERMHTAAEAEEVMKLGESSEKIAAVLKHLETYDERKKGLFAARRQVSRESYKMAVSHEERLWKVVDSVAGCDRHMARLHTEKNRCSNLIASLYPWRALDIPLDMTVTQSSVLWMGYISRRIDVEEMEKRLEEQAEACFLKVLSSDKDHSYLYLIYHTAVEEQVGAVLKEYGFTRVAFNDMEGTAADNIENAQKCIYTIEGEYAETLKNMGVYAEDVGNLEILYDHIGMGLDRKNALAGMAGTGSTFILEGWIPAHLSRYVAEKLERKWDCLAAVREPEPEEEYPVLLENCEMGKTVEAITAMYSAPHPREADPNFVMSLFFIFFYGLMVGDGVYGMIMILASALILWKVRLEENIHRFMKLMLFCGISTVVWGALFGGWFGIPALSRHSLWLNPMEKPEEFLRWSLLFGVIHIYVGIGIKGFNLFRKKKYLAILLDVVVWYVFFTGFCLFVLPYVFNAEAGRFKELVAAGQWLLGAGAVMVILTQGRDRKNIFMKFFSGLAKLYDLIKFMSDVLSYSRLMALGLATSVIGFIVYEIGAMNGLDNVIKLVSFVLIMIVGHALNFAIGLLSAYVHSCRLQYIEFFSRFYKGGGIAFKPLKANTRYIRLTTQDS